MAAATDAFAIFQEKFAFFVEKIELRLLRQKLLKGFKEIPKKAKMAFTSFSWNTKHIFTLMDFRHGGAS